LAGLCQAVRAGVRIYTEVAIETCDFRKRKFNPGRPDRGNKSTVHQPPDDGRVAISAASSTRPGGGATFPVCAFVRETIVSASAEGIGDIQRFNSLLRSAPSRIGRRFAEIVAIAAASLPAAGA
jgi:hypothetical protein